MPHFIDTVNTGTSLETIYLDGLTTYQNAFVLQIQRWNSIEKGEAGNALFLLEHKPVITLGRNSHQENILKKDDELFKIGIDVCKANRGGDVTYHGPGQLIAYPILNLVHFQKSIKWYLRSLEEIIIMLLDEYGIKGDRIDGMTGVWVDGEKIAALGVGIKNWVTFHGISINVSPNMTHFDYIIPCGITDKPVTSMKKLLGETPDIKDVMLAFNKNFRQFFLAENGAC